MLGIALKRSPGRKLFEIVFDQEVGCEARVGRYSVPLGRVSVVSSREHSSICVTQDPDAEMEATIAAVLAAISTSEHAGSVVEDRGRGRSNVTSYIFLLRDALVLSIAAFLL